MWNTPDTLSCEIKKKVQRTVSHAPSGASYHLYFFWFVIMRFTLHHYLHHQHQTRSPPPPTATTRQQPCPPQDGQRRHRRAQPHRDPRPKCPPPQMLRPPPLLPALGASWPTRRRRRPPSITTEEEEEPPPEGREGLGGDGEGRLLLLLVVVALVVGAVGGRGAAASVGRQVVIIRVRVHESFFPFQARGLGHGGETAEACVCGNRGWGWLGYYVGVVMTDDGVSDVRKKEDAPSLSHSRMETTLVAKTCHHDPRVISSDWSIRSASLRAPNARMSNRHAPG